MDRHGDVVAEGVVIQHINAEEKYDVDQPTADRDSVWLDEEWRTCKIELRDIACDSDEEELYKGQKRS